MGFDQIKFYQFRNWVDGPIDLGAAKEIVFTGENGQGKTNFLEGIYLLCCGSSFRWRTTRRS